MANPVTTIEIPITAQQEILRWAREQLKKVKVKTFTATPNSIDPFGTSQLVWEVNDPQIGFELKINGQSVNKSGSMNVAPTKSVTYRLEAHLVGAMRVLKTARVEVDDEGCVEIALFDSQTESQLNSLIHQFLSQDTGVTVRGSGVQVGTSRNGMAIYLPLKVDVPIWFDAHLDMHLHMKIKAENTRVVVTLDDFNMNISWHFLEHVASLGITGILQAVLESILGPIFQRMIREELASGFQAFVNETATGLGSGYQLYLIEEKEFYLSFIFCPSNAGNGDEGGPGSGGETNPG